MTPDAIPVRPLSSVAVLPPDAVRTLFGDGARLSPTARVALVRLGTLRSHVTVETGSDLALHLDRLDAHAAESDHGLRLQGPAGTLDAPAPRPLPSRLSVPEGLKGAWRIGAEATVGVGAVAARVPVETGDLALWLDRALWLGAGSPETARWLPQTTWASAPAEDIVPDPRIATIAGRVVTETDVRQARLRRQRIQLRADQIVTPAARSLAREWDVFET